MSDWYAQSSGDWMSISWNTMPDGSGSYGNPTSGDTAYPNNYLVNMHNVDLSGITIGSGDGAFYSSKWYAMGPGAFNEVYWNTHQTGMGYVDPMGNLPFVPLGQTTELDHNGYAVDLANVNVAPYSNLYLDGTYWWSSKVYANANGAWNSCGWNTSVNTDGLALEFPGPFNAGTPTACITSHHVTATAGQIITPVSVTTGSLTIGTPLNVTPENIKKDVVIAGVTGTLEVESGPTQISLSPGTYQLIVGSQQAIVGG